jgi:hypothetical protein
MQTVPLAVEVARVMRRYGHGTGDVIARIKAAMGE